MPLARLTNKKTKIINTHYATDTAKNIMTKPSNSVNTAKTSQGLCNVMNSFILTLLTLIILLISHNAYALSKVTAVVDKNPAMINESILLTVTADDNVNNNALDTRPLLKDFIVGQTRVSSQTNIVNFSATRMTKWQVTLIARRTGQYTIPALTVEDQQTAPIVLNVIAANDPSSTKQTDIFITSVLSTDEVYVQQSLTLSIKLHFAVDLHSASIDKPELTGAIIEKIGKDKQTDGLINGKRYRIIEQTYAITPEQSGEFIISGPVFSGEIRQASNRRSNFFSYAQTKPVSLIGDELNITVLPIPVTYPSNAQWLPTDILTLHQEWQGNNGQFIVGEPITRIITLTAAGLSKAQLPKLTMQSSPGLKIYPDQAELHSSLRNNRLFSQKIQSFALIPSTAGDFILPEMQVTWFNTVTNKIEQATLPSQTISVQPANESITLNDQSESSSTRRQNDSSDQGVNLTNDTSQQSSVTNTQLAVQDKSLQWLFLSLWLFTLLAWLTHIIYLKKALPKKVQPHIITHSGNHYLALLAVCKKNNAEQTLNLLLPWLKQLLADNNVGIAVHNIAQAQTMVQNQSFTHAVTHLQQFLYGKNKLDDSSPWQGTDLLSAIQAVNKYHQAKHNTHQKMSLNP